MKCVLLGEDVEYAALGDRMKWNTALRQCYSVVTSEFKQMMQILARSVPTHAARWVRVGENLIMEDDDDLSKCKFLQST